MRYQIFDSNQCRIKYLQEVDSATAANKWVSYTPPPGGGYP
jgi:hypothetical protein